MPVPRRSSSSTRTAWSPDAQASLSGGPFSAVPFGNRRQWSARRASPPVPASPIPASPIPASPVPASPVPASNSAQCGRRKRSMCQAGSRPTGGKPPQGADTGHRQSDQGCRSDQDGVHPEERGRSGPGPCSRVLPDGDGEPRPDNDIEDSRQQQEQGQAFCQQHDIQYAHWSVGSLAGHNARVITPSGIRPPGIEI